MEIQENGDRTQMRVVKIKKKKKKSSCMLVCMLMKTNQYE